MDAVRHDYYQFGGLQTDVSPFLMQDSDLSSCVNMFTKKYGAKQTRFGYVKIADNPDNEMVQALNFSRYGDQSYLMRVSGSKIYRSALPLTTWGASTYTLISPPTVTPQFTQLAGDGLPVGAPTSTAYTHVVDGYSGYLVTTDGITFQPYPFLAVLSKNPPKFVTAWRARAYANSDLTRFAFSSKEFDLYVNLNYTDPGQLNRPWNIPVADANNDPGAWGIPDQQNAGFMGDLVDITNGVDRVNLYYQNGVLKWNEQTTIELPFSDNVIPNMITTGQRSQRDYFLGAQRIYTNDGNTIAEVSFGVRQILQDTFLNNGIGDHAFAFAWSEFIFFYFGDMTVDGKLLQNAMLVYNEDFNEWYVWSLAHDMSCMGTYADDSGNVVLISGDTNGNTYVWDRAYVTDDGEPIPYSMRTKYYDFGTPEQTKITAGPGDKCSVSMKVSQNAKFSAAPDYTDQFTPQVASNGPLTKFILTLPSKSFKTICFEVSGSSDGVPAEFYGMTIKYNDQDTRPGERA